MSQLQVTGEAKIRDIQGPVVANNGVVTALDGAASQYVRGDGTLADFPTSTGGGSSVSYYLNSSVSQGTIGGVAYRQLSKEPIIGAGTDITISANGYVANYLTDANDPDVILVPGGNFNCEFYFSVNNNTGNPTTYAELYKYDGTTFTLLGSSVGVPESINQGTTIAPYYFAIPVATATLALTDRLAIRIYVNVDGRTVTLHTENSHLCQVVTTLSKGMVSLNNLTDQSQFITTGTSGTDFNIVSSGDTHTFNIPSASASNRGLITTGTQTIAGAKTFSSLITGDAGIILKEGVVPSLVGYTGLAGDADGLVVTKRIGSTAYTNLLYFNSATSNTYTFPNLTGTLALLEGTQTFSGDKTFNGGVDFNNALNINNTFNLRNNLVGSTLYTNFSILKSGSLQTLTYLFSTANSSNLVFNDAANYTYTFPTTSGTLALTSNLSSYVPYTGATTNVDLGTNEITARNFIAENSFSAKHLTSGIAYRNGYTTLSANADSFVFAQAISAGNLKTAIFDTSNLINNTSYTYTLPAASGSLALLESTQTFTGNKTFNQVSFDNSPTFLTNSVAYFMGNAYLNKGIAFSDTGTPAIFSDAQGFTINRSGTTSTMIIRRDIGASSYYQTLTFTNNAANRTYTFPDATGTIALTSNLSSYVPYTGATAAVNLGSNALTALTLYSNAGLGLSNSGQFTGGGGYTGINGRTDGIDIRPNNGGIFQFIFSNTTNRTYTFPDATGTIALTSNLSSYLPLTGGTLTGGLYINPTNTGVIGLDVASNNTSFRSDNLEGSKRQLLMTMGSGTLIQLTAKGYEAARPTDLAFYTSTSGGVNASPTIYMTGGGNVGIGTGSPSGILQVQNVQDGVSGKNLTLAYNGTYYAEYTEKSIRAYNNELIIGTGTGGTERMRISAGGNIGIGTTTGTSFFKLNIDGHAVHTTSSYATDGANDPYRAGVGWQSAANPGVVLSSLFTTINDGNYGGHFVWLSRGTNGGNMVERMRITSGGLVAIGGSNATFIDYSANVARFYGGSATNTFGLGAGSAIYYQGDNSQFYPTADNARSIGLGSLRYTAIWAVNGTIQTSDEREKTDIIDSDLGLDFVTKLRPVSFKWKVGQNTETTETITDEEGNEKIQSVITPRAGIRTHYGLIAQEVEQLLNGKDFGGFIHDKDSDVKGLRYDQFVPLLIKAIQEQQAQIEELKALINK